MRRYWSGLFKATATQPSAKTINSKFGRYVNEPLSFYNSNLTLACPTNMLNFYALIEQSARTIPTALAIRWPQTDDLTFGQLTKRVNAVRQQLASQGVRPGDVCLLAVPPSPAAVVALLALLAEGAVVLLPPAGLRLGQWNCIRKDGQVRAIIAGQHPSLKIRALGLLTGIKLVRIAPHTTTTIPDAPYPVPETQPALITFSSGSTGRPRPIRRNHAVLTHQHEALLHHFPALAGSLDFPLFPNVLLHNLAAGIGTLLPDIPGFRLDQLQPEKIIAQLQSEAVRTLTGNVFYFTRLANYAEARQITLPAVKAVGVGGSPVPEFLLARLQMMFPAAKVYVIYGSSEAEPIAVRKFVEPLDPLLGYAVGPIHPGLRWKLGATDCLAPGNIGELLVRGPHVVIAPGQQWFATGDIGYVKDEKLVLTARRGNETVIGGKQHYQLEHYLQHQPGVKKVAVLARGKVFDIVFEGPGSAVAVRAATERVIGAKYINAVRHTPHLPMDARHQSKILYRKIKP